VAVAALAVVAGASAATSPTGCAPNPYYQSPACAASQGLDPGIQSYIAQTKDSEAAASTEAQSLTSHHGLGKAIDQALAQAKARESATAGGSSFNWGSAGIGAVGGAVLLIAAVGSGAIVRRRRPLHA
jgi:hypothetical protein